MKPTTPGYDGKRRDNTPRRSPRWVKTAKRLDGLGTHQLSVEKNGSVRCTVPRAYSHPETGIPDLLAKPWHLTYRRKGVLGLVPAEHWDEYKAFAWEEVQSRSPTTPMAFHIQYIGCGRLVRLDAKNRLYIEKDLAGNLDYDSSLTIVPYEGFFEIFDGRALARETASCSLPPETCPPTAQNNPSGPVHEKP